MQINPFLTRDKENFLAVTLPQYGRRAGATYGRSRDVGFVLSKTKGTAMEYSDVTRKGALRSGTVCRLADFMHTDSRCERGPDVSHGRGTTE
jgi:hypothetical protein